MQSSFMNVLLLLFATIHCGLVSFFHRIEIFIQFLGSRLVFAIVRLSFIAEEPAGNSISQSVLFGKSHITRELCEVIESDHCLFQNRNKDQYSRMLSAWRTLWEIYFHFSTNRWVILSLFAFSREQFRTLQFDSYFQIYSAIAIIFCICRTLKKKSDSSRWTTTMIK